MNKYAFAAQAIVGAIDLPVFDGMGIGLIAAPSARITGPLCEGGFDVACGVPSYAQIAPRLAGVKRSSDDVGVRHDMKQWLDQNAPDTVLGDGNPLYETIRAGITVMQTLDISGARSLFVVTDGQLSCTSLSSRPGFNDINGCPDWENPNNVIDLVTAARTDPRAPVQTFVVGVPGADTYDPTGRTAPPYRMRAALSAIAKAGAPGFVPAACSAVIPFDVSAPDPQTSCHFDMSQSYSVAQVSDAIARVRASSVSCNYRLSGHGPIDPAKVNVSAGATPLRRRTSPTDTCSDGCWDYTASNDIALLGTACTDAMNGARVTVAIGCPTEVR